MNDENMNDDSQVSKIKTVTNIHDALDVLLSWLDENVLDDAEVLAEENNDLNLVEMAQAKLNVLHTLAAEVKVSLARHNNDEAEETWATMEDHYEVLNVPSEITERVHKLFEELMDREEQEWTQRCDVLEALDHALAIAEGDEQAVRLIKGIISIIEQNKE